MSDAKKKTTRPEQETAHELGVEEQIRVRAYQIYELRGKEDGRDLDDWLLAEEEVLQKPRAVAA